MRDQEERGFTGGKEAAVDAGYGRTWARSVRR
jgi:hypothetical protein